MRDSCLQPELRSSAGPPGDRDWWPTLWPSCQALLFSGPPILVFLPHPQASFPFGFSRSGHEMCLLGPPSAPRASQPVRAQGSELN